MLHPNKEHIHKRELLKQVKREKRGVEREMRREAEVISEVAMGDALHVDERRGEERHRRAAEPEAEGSDGLAGGGPGELQSCCEEGCCDGRRKQDPEQLEAIVTLLCLRDSQR